MKRVLIACEYSGRVREAFRALGHDAWSCDLLPAEDSSPFHIQGDCLEIVRRGWDLMVAHPPCTHLAVSGALHFPAKIADGRQKSAIEFFMALASAPVERIAIENPVCIMSSIWRQPDQVIQPWQFGENASKLTCLWLKNIPCLIPTQVLRRSASGRWANQTASGQNRLSPGPDRWKERSRTFSGVASAMAHQWTHNAPSLFLPAFGEAA